MHRLNKNFKENIKFDLRERKNKKDILAKIEANPILIYSISNERLIQLIQIQQEDIEELFNRYSTLISKL